MMETESLLQVADKKFKLLYNENTELKTLLREIKLKSFVIVCIVFGIFSLLFYCLYPKYFKGV